MIQNPLVIVDYGIGNTSSIHNMIRKVGGNATISNDLDVLKKAKILILPGVGAFDNAVLKLKALGIWEVLNQKILVEKVPFLGICLGMQLLFESSEEGNLNGFGWLKGNVKRFNFSEITPPRSYKVPHMGWNLVNIVDHNNLYAGLEKKARFYFVHTFYADCMDSSDIIATSNYGLEFACSVNKENIWGVQFHPEKSHRFGITFFENFLRLTKC